MKSKKNYYLPIFICLIIFFVISIISIYSFLPYLPSSMQNLVIKQTIFYFIGIIFIIIINKIGINKILKYSFHIYIINIILLFLVLFFGTKINGARAWFVIPIFGSFQPSEFMKIGITLMIAKVLHNNTKSDLSVIIKVFIITLIPAILTFLEPDTGAIIIYFSLAIFMLFIYGIKYRWFAVLFAIIAVGLFTILYLFFFKEKIFINLFGSSLFYRIDRLFDWTTSSGMQLENSIIALASSGLFGHGTSNIPIYFPEGQTDFIFSSFVCLFGLTGMIFLIIIIITFDLTLIKNLKRKENPSEKYIIAGFLGAIIYQQIQNIAMTIGLLPITGITLPFISYGGSSLLSYMIFLGIIISDQDKKETSLYKRLK